MLMFLPHRMFTTLVIVHEMAFPLSSLKLSIYSSCTFFFSSAAAAEAAICCVVLWQWLFFPSLPPVVYLNPSLSLSVYFLPSSMQHHSFSSGNELFCLLSLLPSLSLILLTGNNSLSSPLPPHPHPVSCRVHQILSALSGTMETRKLLTVTLTLV